MSLRIYCLAATAAIMLHACSKQTQPAPADDPSSTETRTPIENAIATNVTVTYTDESSFVNSLSSYGFKNPAQLNLNRVGTSSGYTAVYGFNIPSDRQVKGFKWNSGDEQTTEWRPQGITGFTWSGRNFLLVTWFGCGPNDIEGVANQHKGVRVSLVDITSMSNITYRHILLVQNKANMSNSELYRATNSYVQLGSYAPVTIHAGGVACYAGKIYVADTRLGIRVFDLSKFISASTGDTDERIGKETDGSLKAFNYAYILPQSGYYKITNASPFSCIELGSGATSSDKMLWTGQYVEAGSTTVPKVYGFHLNASGQIVTSPQPEVITPIDNDNTNVHGIQGVYRAGTKTFMTTTGNTSYEGSTARLTRYNDGAAAGVRYRWPHGTEDLYLEPATGYLWNLTEYETSKYGEDNRCVFAVRLSDYD
ncbi:hypothetical protein FAM09_19260 [Niastella caeni]|uniref:Uncharacterized protein n=1 Tax=Niastella caeni TaxID=2569763 RepID=A0A4S8HP65_9BACT|nr:hypothetical protein [Niastella caeni]THU37093.1 hypothetical protein FAM09_19260 [Niastella caeni]